MFSDRISRIHSRAISANERSLDPRAENAKTSKTKKLPSLGARKPITHGALIRSEKLTREKPPAISCLALALRENLIWKPDLLTAARPRARARQDIMYRHRASYYCPRATMKPALRARALDNAYTSCVYARVADLRRGYP